MHECKQLEGSPLDLSTVRKRERPSTHHSSTPAPAEKRRASDAATTTSSHGVATLFNTKSASSSSSSTSSDVSKMASDASKALERMTELTRLSGERSGSGVGGVGGRQSAWQSHWLSKGADTAKDVLKCVWCKLSFDSLASLTSHMKESKHCGVNASLMGGGASTPPAGAGTPVTAPSPPVTSVASVVHREQQLNRSKASSASGNTIYNCNF